MNSPANPPPRNQAGFTLVEVLVAIAIAGISMFGLMRLMNTAIDGSGRAAQTSTALLVAESRLAAVGIEQPIKTGQTSGRTAEGFGWSIDIKPYTGLKRALAEGIPVQAFEVVVSVAPPAGAEISIRTLRLKPRETAGDRP